MDKPMRAWTPDKENPSIGSILTRSAVIKDYSQWEILVLRNLQEMIEDDEDPFQTLHMMLSNEGTAWLHPRPLLERLAWELWNCSEMTKVAAQAALNGHSFPLKTTADKGVIQAVEEMTLADALEKADRHARQI